MICSDEQPRSGVARMASAMPAQNTAPAMASRSPNQAVSAAAALPSASPSATPAKAKANPATLPAWRRSSGNRAWAPSAANKGML